MRIRRIGTLLLLLFLLLTLAGCRTRTTLAGEDRKSREGENMPFIQAPESSSLPDEEGEENDRPEEQDGDGGVAGQTKENPEAARKEYDEQAPVEIVPGTDRTVHGEGEGGGSSMTGESADAPVHKLNDAADKTATETVAADQAEQMGVSEDAEEADSAMTYFTVLLADRMGSLFECQRMNVYWETAEDHVTIFKTSPEHTLILNAGAYDVSARLLKENLRVDDGWIARKNPDVIVKVVGSAVLGTGVTSAAAAEGSYADLIARDGWSALGAVRNGRVLLLSEELLAAPYLQVAAMLAVAKTASPDLLSDVELEKALAMLAEEATGSIPTGIYWYNSHGGFQ